jgi:dienelactone hydrolase
MDARWTPRLVAALVGAIAMLPCLTSAQTMNIQIYPLQTVTVTSEQFLTGSKDGKPAVVAGELRVPNAGADRVPAVVIVHGRVGVGDHEDNWARELNQIGIAAFILDSFTGRNVGDTRANLTQSSPFTTLVDGYRALELLSGHPRIDPTKIAILGFSGGATAALRASLKRFQALYGPTGIEFAAYIGFYTPCDPTYIDDENVSDKPIRLFHGTSDDWVPVEACRRYVERLRKIGKDITLTEYPNSYHRFDDLGLKTPMFLPQAQTYRNCVLVEGPAGKLVNQKTGMPFTPADPCVERGVTVAFNADAQNSSLRAVKAFLMQTFDLH